MIDKSNFYAIPLNSAEKFVRASILSSAKNVVRIPEYKYHHNTKYEDIISILDYGILSLKDQIEYNIRFMGKNMFENLSDEESHINGIDGISLSIVGLTDLSKDEEVYDPCMEGNVDILISDKVKAMRNSRHYGNEFITYNKVDTQYIKGIDLRILKLISKYASKGEYKKIIILYNQLIRLSQKLVEQGATIPLREMSYDALLLDVDTLSKKKKLYSKYGDRNTQIF